VRLTFPSKKLKKIGKEEKMNDLIPNENYEYVEENVVFEPGTKDGDWPNERYWDWDERHCPFCGNEDCFEESLGMFRMHNIIYFKCYECGKSWHQSWPAPLGILPDDDAIDPEQLEDV
jgi:hypothetical protein